HLPAAASPLEVDGRHHLPLAGPFRRRLPAAHVVAASDHARPDPFGDPGLEHEIPDLRLHPDQLTGADPTPAASVDGVDPERVAMRYLVQPLGVGASAVDLDREAEGWNEHHLPFLEVGRVHVAPDVGRNRVLGPAPLGKRARVELEPAAGRRKTAPDPPIELHTDRSPALGVWLRRRLWDDIRTAGTRCPGEDAAQGIGNRPIQLVPGHLLLVDGARPTLDLEGAVAPHPLQRRQPLGRRPLGQARYGVLEDPAVVLVHAELRPRLLLRLEIGSDAERPVGIDAPGELDPELVLLPDLAGVDLAGVADRLSEAGASCAH